LPHRVTRPGENHGSTAQWKGRIPQYRGTGSDALLDVLGKIDVFDDIVRKVEGSFGKELSDLA
jgi:hypothetical protein